MHSQLEVDLLTDELTEIVTDTTMILAYAVTIHES
jgi:hypothetical protein